MSMLCRGKHVATMTFTHRPRDGFRRRWWIRCWNCDLRLGPYTSRAETEERVADLWHR